MNPRDVMEGLEVEENGVGCSVINENYEQVEDLYNCII
jgi:hypothetical protein